ncbi:MAG: 4-(cytidine 5'-diphospho)-2-C-methyl-D-erythritol kinase [Gemmatimonadaceae bacterium]
MTPRAARLVAQAKVNLFLRVLSRERSGYHSLETLFTRIDLGDEVRIRVGGAARTVRCSGPALPAGGLGPPEANVAFRAADAYAQAAGWPSGFEIDIEKRIPVGAGLGGGSADAGAVLRALNALAPNPLPRSSLLTLAAGIGADVPFLTLEEPLALAWGRGERLLALPPLPTRAVSLFLPSFGISTADAFGWLAATRARDTPRGETFSLRQLGAWEGVASLAGNELEPVVCAQQPLLRELLRDVRDAMPGAIVGMTGSGSAVFAIARDSSDAAAASAARSAGARHVRTLTSACVVAMERSE